MYSFNKFDKIIEAIKTDKYTYLIFKLETLDDFKKAQRELFKQKFIWITDDTRVRDVKTDDDYPLYIFVIGNNSKDYKRKFFYDCISGLNNGSLQRTILARQQYSTLESICPKIFTIYDINHVDRLFNYQESPSYAPKKFDRTLESVQDYPYDEIVVRVEDKDELIELQDKFKTIGNCIQDLSSTMTLFPNWVFIKVYNFQRTKDFLICYLTDYANGVEDCFARHITDDPNVNKTIFKLSDWNKVKNILLYSKDRIEPSYKPKKFDRTIESVSFEPIDIDEISIFITNDIDNNRIQEDLFQLGYKWYTHGNQWVHPLSDRTNEIVLTFFYSDKMLIWAANIKEFQTFHSTGWRKNPTIFTADDWPRIVNFIRYGRETPSYAPKKFDRTLEALSDNYIPYADIVIKANNAEELKQVQDKLNELEYRTLRRVDEERDFPIYILVGLSVKDYVYLTNCENDESLVKSIEKFNVGAADKINPLIFNHNDVNDLDTIKKFGTPSRIPNYRPRIISRTLEAKENYMYNRVVFKADNQEQNIIAQKALFNLGIRWGVNRENIVSFDNYPIYLFTPDINDYRKDLTYMYFPQNSSRNINSYILERNKERNNICLKVFNYNEVPYLEMILKKGRYEPSYAPKKFDRTLESNNDIHNAREICIVVNDMEEFNQIKDECSLYDYKINSIPRGFPHYIFIDLKDKHTSYINSLEAGYMSITDETNSKYILGGVYKKRYTINDLDVIRIMLKTGKIMDEPSYKPRKFDRTLEDKDNNLYFSIICSDRESSEACEDFLQKNGYYWDIDSGKRRDVLKDYPHIQSVIFCDFNTSDKLFKGWEYPQILNYKSWTDTHSNYTELNYPNDIMEINKFLGIKPNYTPKKFDRSLDSLDENVLNEANGNRDLVNCAYFKKYNTLLMVFNRDVDTDKYDKLVKSIKKIFQLEIENNMKGYRNHCDDEKFLYYITLHHGEFRWGWDNYRDFESYIDTWYTYLKPLTIDEIYPPKKLEDILHRGSIAPDYTPKKFDRTLEAIIYNDVTLEEMLKREKSFLIKCWKKDWAHVEKELLKKKEIKWIRHNSGVSILSAILPTINRFDYIYFQITRDKILTWAEPNEYNDREVDVPLIILDSNDKINKFFVQVPSYKPKKFDRTLEANSFEQSLIKKIQSVLTEDLLNPEWKKKLETGKHHPFAGHCYAASEALYHLLGGKEKGYKPMRGVLNGETHWWIRDKEGKILDPTAEQFYYVNLKPPYEKGKGTGFLTKTPSKRAKEIILRIQNI